MALPSDHLKTISMPFNRSRSATGRRAPSRSAPPSSWIAKGGRKLAVEASLEHYCLRAKA